MRSRLKYAIPAGQILQAAVNFLFLLGAARHLEPNIFSAVSVAWIWYTVLIVAQRTILGEQAIVDGGSSSSVSVREMLFPSGLIVGLFFLLSSGLIAVGSDMRSPALMAVVASGAVMIINDAIRYACIAEGESGYLLRSDVTSFVAVLAGFAASETTRSALFVVAAPIPASLLSLIMMHGFVRPRLSTLFEYIRSLGSYFHWATVQVLVTNLAAQAVVVVALPIAGAKDFAGLRALQAALSPISTPATAVQPLLFARLTQRPRTKRAFRPFMTWAAAMTVFFTLLGLLLSASGPIWIDLLVGERYATYAHLALPITLTLGMVYAGLAVATWLRTLRMGRQLVTAQACAIGVGMVLLPVSAWQFGVVGAAWALAAQAVTSVLVAHVLLWRQLT